MHIWVPLGAQPSLYLTQHTNGCPDAVLPGSVDGALSVPLRLDPSLITRYDGGDAKPTEAKYPAPGIEFPCGLYA